MHRNTPLVMPVLDRDLFPRAHEYSKSPTPIGIVPFGKSQESAATFDDPQPHRHDGHHDHQPVEGQAGAGHSHGLMARQSVGDHSAKTYHPYRRKIQSNPFNSPHASNDTIPITAAIIAASESGDSDLRITGIDDAAKIDETTIKTVLPESFSIGQP